MQQLAELRFPARSDHLRRVRRLVRRTLRSLNCQTDFIEPTVLALDEATANVIRHGYEPDETGDIILQILRDDDTLRFRLLDFAKPCDRTQVKPRRLSDVRPGGLGVHIIREVMDSMAFLDPPKGVGNLLELTRKLPGPGQTGVGDPADQT